MTDLIATFMDVPVEERQEVLETFDVRERLKMVADKLGRVAEVLRLSAKIREETQQTLEKAQREYYLREQLRAIQNELGEGDEKADRGRRPHREDRSSRACPRTSRRRR